MKKVFAILALAASLAACARMEQPVDETPVATPEGTETAPTTYTLTVRATKDAGTRVLELDGTTNTLNAKWESGDKVEVYDGETCLGELTAGAVAPDGMSCTFSGELEGLPDETSSLTLKYLSPAYEEQDGTLEYISENCDYAEAEVNVTVEGTTITCGDALFASRQAVVKFLLKDKSGEAVSATSFVVKDGEATYTVNPDEAASELFVALPGIADRPLSLSATAGTDTYTYWRSGVTLNAGQYYSIAVKMDQTIDLGREDIYDASGIFTAQDGNILTGTSLAGKQVRIAPGATVTLRNVNIVHSEDIQYDGIAPDGSATLLLEGTNTVGGGEEHAGISVPEGSTLTIDGNGSLTATGGFRAAGIGGGYVAISGNITVSDDGEDSSVITYDGGFVTATGGEGAADIGARLQIANNATVTLNGVNIPKGIALAGSATINLAGENTVSADEYNAGISVPSGSTLTLQGNGSLTAIGGSGATGIGGGYVAISGNITVSDDGDDSSVITSSGMTVTATGGSNAADIGARLRIANNASVTLNGVNLPKGIELAGSATINLAGENTVSADEYNAGISVPSGSTLTLQGTGSLTATGGIGAAGIGSGMNSSCGDITISGGTVRATGVWGAAGIGSGMNSSCGDITISDGEVAANGGGNAAGIGSGDNGSCGAITINGGTVTATGDWGAAGIGGGDSGSCGAITISGCTVTANGGGNGVGIGSSGSCDAIIISYSTVTATGGLFAAGIGCGATAPGSEDTGGDITIIFPAEVKATKGDLAEFSIGPARTNIPCGTVTINGEVWGYRTGSSFYVENGRLRESPLEIKWP